MMNYIYTGVLVFILSLMSALWYFKKENDKLLKNEGIYKAQISELAGTLQSKDKTIDLCSERTKQMVEEAARRAKDAEKARSEAREASKKNRELADQLLSFKPKEGENSCDASERLFNEYLEKRAQ